MTNQGELDWGHPFTQATLVVMWEPRRYKKTRRQVMLWRRSQGRTMQQIGDEFGVSSQYVSRLLLKHK